MKKSLIALAVASAFAAPAMAATGNVDVYGQVRFSVDNVDVGTSSTTTTDNWQFNDRVSRIGFKGSEDLGGGLKALWQIEQQLSTSSGALNAGPTDTAGVMNGNGRNTFLGLAGDFGTVILGRHDTPYKLAGSADVFADTAADAQCGTIGGSANTSQCVIGRNGFDTRANGTIAYVSPTWSGFHFAAAIVPGEESGATAGDADGLMDAYSLAAIYANGPLKLTAGYENYDSSLVGTAKDADAWKLNGSYSFGDLAVGLTYEASTTGGASQDNDKGWLASVTYGMGPITLAAQYGSFNNDNGRSGDLDRWTVGAIYALSKRTNAYVAYHDGEVKGAAAANDLETKVWTMGMNHSF